jgi:TPP-dependent pyruvate/acetoin dehydrogenase alpha subunit
VNAQAHGHLAAVPEVDDLELLETSFRWMLMSRTIEERLRSVYKQGRLRGRLLSGRGQEATAVGSALALEDTDVVAPVHRDLGVHLVRGTTPLTIFRQYLGRRTGPSQGRDGDLHTGEWSRGVFPMVSHLPDSWPVFTGVALAFKLRREPRVAVAYCGDGATSTGAWHEAVNFASVAQLPMVLVVENNQYAYSTPNDTQFRCARLADRAAGYGIPGVQIDGNDVEAVYGAVSDAVAAARQGHGPTLIEAVTMRMEGHAFHDDHHYVPQSMMDEWAERDPLVRTEAILRGAGWDDDRFTALREELDAEVRGAWAEAEAEELPTGAEVEHGVYATDAP